jgi:hypothetical protein
VQLGALLDPADDRVSSREGMVERQVHSSH